MFKTLYYDENFKLCFTKKKITSIVAKSVILISKLNYSIRFDKMYVGPICKCMLFPIKKEFSKSVYI